VRDGHRIREKYELAVDNKQIVSLVIAGIVVMGTVFVLGVVVGKNLAGPQRSVRAADLLSALDEKAAAMEQVRSEPQLTFEDELTKKSAPEARPSAVGSKPEPENRGADDKRAAVNRAGPEPAPAAAPPPRPVPSDAVVDSPGGAPSESSVRTEKRSDASPESVTTSPKPATAGKSRVQEAIARVEKNPAEPIGPEGAFTLQLAASQARADADRFAARLREKGYAPYVMESDVPGRGKWYRVRMGRFGSKEAAMKYLQDFRRETQLDAFVAAAN
jgi:septal ring-binding cell division protein DamX